jgi:hypothetical protein
MNRVLRRIFGPKRDEVLEFEWISLTSLYIGWQSNIGLLGTTAVMVHGTRRMNGQEKGESCTMRSFIFCTYSQISGRSNQIKSKRVRWTGHVACMVEEIEGFSGKVRRKETTWKTEA